MTQSDGSSYFSEASITVTITLGNESDKQAPYAEGIKLQRAQYSDHNYHYQTFFDDCLRPAIPADFLKDISKRELSLYLDILTPGQIKQPRLNPLRNAVALDTDNALAVQALLYVTTLGIPVRPYIQREPNTTVRGISGLSTPNNSALAH